MRANSIQGFPCECLLFDGAYNANTTWIYHNLADQANSEFVHCSQFDDQFHVNPLSDPFFQTSWLNQQASELKAKTRAQLQSLHATYDGNEFEGRHFRTYGGWLEPRFKLWENIEPLAMKSKTMLHLAVDVNNLEPGTPVLSPCDNMRVIHRMVDESKTNGWGGRVILEIQENSKVIGSPQQQSKSELSSPGTNPRKFLLLGHLDPSTLPKVDMHFLKGDVIAHIGDESVNGGWFPHVHVQLMTQKFLDKLTDKWDEIDVRDQRDAFEVLNSCKLCTFL